MFSRDVVETRAAQDLRCLRFIKVRFSNDGILFTSGDAARSALRQKIDQFIDKSQTVC